jgi:hypothetical protein
MEAILLGLAAGTLEASDRATDTKVCLEIPFSKRELDATQMGLNE